MKIKLNTGLIATNGDGKPSFRPPIPAGWCRPLTSSSSEEAHPVKCDVDNTYKSDSIMSSENGSAVRSPGGDESASRVSENSPQNVNDESTDVKESEREHESAPSSNQITDNSPPDGGTSAAESSSLTMQNEVPITTNTSPSPPLSSVPAVSQAHHSPSFEASSPLESSAKAVHSDPNIAENEDSNVDVETEEQLAPLDGSTSAVSSGSMGITAIAENTDSLILKDRDSQIANSATSQSNHDDYMASNSELENVHSKNQDEERALAESDAQYIEKQVVNSFLHQDRPLDIAQTTDVQSMERSEDIHNGSSALTLPVSHSPLGTSDTPVTDSGVGDTTPSSSGGDNGGATQQPEKVMDALSMTIASVAAGEGEPPEYISKFIPDPTKSKAISPHRQGQSHISNKHSEFRFFFFLLSF